MKLVFLPAIDFSIEECRSLMSLAILIFVNIDVDFYRMEYSSYILTKMMVLIIFLTLKVINCKYKLKKLISRHLFNLSLKFILIQLYKIAYAFFKKHP